jgi:hypothetical protein
LRIARSNFVTCSAAACSAAAAPCVRRRRADVLGLFRVHRF